MLLFAAFLLSESEQTHSFCTGGGKLSGVGYGNLGMAKPGWLATMHMINCYPKCTTPNSGTTLPGELDVDTTR
jgi:hypothetical protein